MATSTETRLLALVLVLAPGLTGCTAPAKLPPQVLSAPRPAATKEVLPFVHDDYAAALATAKQTGKPLFVDAWAPWCHSCLSLRSYVLTDPRLAPLADAYVWLSVDTENEKNAAFVAKYPNHAWPTLWVIDPKAEDAILKWEGAPTAPELSELLSARVPDGRAGEATTLYVRANRAAAKGDHAEAKALYQASLATDHPHRARAVEALTGLLSAEKAFGPCAALVVAEAPRMPPGTSRATILALGLAAARESKREGDLRTLEALARAVVADGSGAYLADDRSGIYEELVEGRKEAGDAAGARALAADWAALLEREASRAPNREARAVFDAHRLLAYLALGAPERAVPMLLQSERDFPNDYNPPARLARAYLELHRLDDARAAVDRATAKVYGPRALRVLTLAADIAKAAGDRAGERAALSEALRRTEHLPPTEGLRKQRLALSERVRSLE